ncbi:GspH/FimT family pseudopilin [Vibrio sp. JC009]|uniref:type II secretion system protein n=1 Tax=Vibrio sp. JC009 TaxID=2912314 RepID=UPI0023B1B866|nr:prepilin-type N-terminal cleavage/methylation domain-containing protein [Vibrio sp. JC009]WED21929.1 GspH/FimT family pseudopilin [Vibrio sp. JC009]
MKRNAGFTLIEIMLAMVVLSLGTVAVVMSLPATQEDLAEEEARRFYHRLLLLNEDAVLNGTDFGLRFEVPENQYRYLKLTGEGWQLFESKRYQTKELDEALSFSFSLGNSAWNRNESLFEQSSLFDDQMFAEFKEEKKEKPPQVFVLSSGEITPFNLSIQAQSVKREEDAWRVIALETGEVKLLAPGESLEGAEE